MQIVKWLGCAAVGATMFFAGSSAFAVTIGFSQVGDEGDWRPAWSKDMQEEAKKEGIDLKFADAQGKEEEQLKAVRSFIAQKVDAIIIAPVVITGWDQVLGEAKKAGIPRGQLQHRRASRHDRRGAGDRAQERLRGRYFAVPEHEDRQDAERQFHHRRRQAGHGGLHQVDRQPEGHLRRVRA
jgi:hypothetical protein